MNNFSKIVALSFLLLAGGKSLNAQITHQKIGDNPTMISPSAVLDIESANKGILIPRVNLTGTLDQAPIPTATGVPANGLTVFNLSTTGDVTPGYYYWSTPLTKWVRLIDQEADLRLVGSNNHITQDAGAGSNGTDAGTGAGNILIGQNAGAANNVLNRDNNIMIGADAGIDAQTQEVVAIGWLAAPKLGTTTGGDFDPGVYIGAFAGSEQSTVTSGTNGSGNTIIGNSAGREGQNLNSTIVGHGAGYNSNGENNVILGARAGYSINSNNNIIIGTEILPLNNTVGSQLNIGNWIYGDAGNIAIGNVNPTEKFDVISGNVRIRDINSISGIATDKIVVADGTTGVLKTVNQSSVAIEPWNVIGQPADTKATANTDNIYQTGSVAIGANTIPTITAGATTVNPKLHVDGDISTTGKLWTTNSVYADYVFEYYYDGFSKIYDKYKFKSLKEVAEFIKTNRHLPGVTPIDEIIEGENGFTIDLTELSMQQLEKLEELYLHVIEINDKMMQKDQQIQELQNKTQELEERLLRLERMIENK